MMDFDFELLLTVLVGVFGVGYALDVWLWKPARIKVLELAITRAGGELPEAQQVELMREPMFAEYSRSFFPVLAFVLVLRSFFMEPYQIPSGSMLPTLTVGDFIVVNKFEYGVRLPVLGTKVFDYNKPKAGDVMVFKYPLDEKVKYIKRVIGIPGDRIEYRNKNLYVNGEIMNKKPLDNAAEKLLISQLDYQTINKYRKAGGSTHTEILGSVEHLVWNFNSPARNYDEIVPENEYFTMGDNRDGSNDSRYWGFVPEANITGKAVAVWLHWDSFFSLPNFSTAGSID